MIEKPIATELLNSKGSIDVITGPMFCGKSDELIRRLRRYRIAINAMQQNGMLELVDIDERIKVFKSTIDNRRGKDTVNTNDGAFFPAIEINKANEALDRITDKTIIVAFDEAQFFDENDLVDTSMEFAKRGVKLIVSGLSMDFAGRKWGGVGTLALGGADRVDVLTAICTKCGDSAQYSQRIIEEVGLEGNKTRRPADYNEPITVVGGTDIYEARCRIHHEVPGKI